MRGTQTLIESNTSFKMKIYVKFDIHTIYAKVLEDVLKDFGILYRTHRMGEIEILKKMSQEMQQSLEGFLEQAGVSIVDDAKFKLVDCITITINEMIYEDDTAHRHKTSTYLWEKLNYTYNHLSEVFSQATLGSIENFVIFKKRDYAKILIIEGKITFTEIAYKLNYRNSAHLSTQFKRTTGLTPTNFIGVIEERNTTIIMSNNLFEIQ